MKLKALLLFITLTALTSCSSDGQEIIEPSPLSTEAVTKINTKNTYDFAGELALKSVNVPILHSRDTITIEIYPIHRVVADWTFLESKLDSHQFHNTYRSENCQIEIYTFKEYINKTPYMENLKSHHISIKLNNNLIDINKDAHWVTKNDHFEITIKNPHLKGAELIIENKTIEDVHYIKTDNRTCANTKIIKFRKYEKGAKVEGSEHYVFDYNIY